MGIETWQTSDTVELHDFRVSVAKMHPSPRMAADLERDGSRPGPDAFRRCKLLKERVNSFDTRVTSPIATLLTATTRNC
jgi:hypothetical protein